MHKRLEELNPVEQGFLHSYRAYLNLTNQKQMDSRFYIDNRDLAGILQEKVFEGPRHVVIDLTR